MRELPPALAAHLAGETTTLAYCWRLERRDGVILRLTDHDRALEVEGEAYEPGAALEASARETSGDLSVDNLNGLGALTADAINEADLLAGRYDGARIDIYLVNWEAPTERLQLSAGSLGEAIRRDSEIELEVRGLKATLDEPVGRTYQKTCDARLGDARCGVDTADPVYAASGTVSTLRSAREIAVAGLDGFEEGWFASGEIVWTAGARAGLSERIVRHVIEPTTPVLILSERPHPPIAEGDAFTVVAGCDKRFETCRDKFSNVLNFRGFHKLPGDDFIYGYPTADGPLDGSPR